MSKRRDKARKILWAVGIILFLTSIASAVPRNTNDAKKVVRGWLYHTQSKPLDVSMGRAVKKVDTFADPNDETVYYIVYLEPSGFVIVPADDLVEPIIGFASAGHYDPSLDNPLGALVTQDLNARTAVVREVVKRGEIHKHKSLSDNENKWRFLEDTGEQFGESVEMGAASISDVRVAPLVQSRWDQTTVCGNNCYNIYTPNNYVCGCVATAMAQLMRFYQHPTQPIGIGPFDIWVNGNQQTRSLRGGNGSGGSYDWSNMILDPTCSITQTQRNAIGALCHDAGVASHMSYNAGGSGTWMDDAQDSLLTVFSYSNAVHGGVWHSNTNLGAGLTWMVNPNLDAGFLVLLAIYGIDGGHAVVCDGYGFDNSTLYHHLNLGWGENNSAQNVWYNLPDIDSTPHSFTTVSICLYNIYITGLDEIISGRVADSSGNPLSGATVTATRTGGGIYTATTNSRGIYALAKIPSNSTYTIQVSKSGYSFADRNVSTGESTDFSTTSGNVWAVDFTEGAPIPNTPPQLSNPRIIPISGNTSTNFEFLVNYYDADGDPPHPIYRKVYISGTGGQAEGTMWTLKSGSPANGTYSYTMTLPQGSYYYMFMFADTKEAFDMTSWQSGPYVYSDSDAVINIVIQCTRISSDLRLKYSLTGSGGPWTDIPITKQILDPLAVPAGSTVWFQADVASPNYQYREWELWENGSRIGGSTSNMWSFTLGTSTTEVGLNVFYNYTPQYYTISGTVLKSGGVPVPGGVDLTLTSDVQTLSQHTDNGSFSFTGVQGGVSVTITPSANGYGFSPANLVYNNLKDNYAGQIITAYASDDYSPVTSFLTVPPTVSENSSVSFSWTGNDNVTVPANLQYQYKLEGVDADWSAWSSGTTKSYDANNGAYTFWVRAKDEAGNINQAPISYKFVVNAAPKIISVERISNSVWASRITLQMPQGATHPTNTFILLPQHSGINDSELVPVRMHYADDVNACGANAIIASQLGLTTRIAQAGTGWLVTLPQSIPSGQTVQYDIVWGKIKYFGWQESVSVPLNFPNGGTVQDSYLNDDLRLWRLATKNVQYGGNVGETKAWVLRNISDRYGSVVAETIIRHQYGQPWNGSLAYSIIYNYGNVVKAGPKMTILWNDNKDAWDGSRNYYYRRYGLQTFETGEIFSGQRDGTYVDRCYITFPEESCGKYLWLIGETGGRYEPDPTYLWFTILDSDATEVISQTNIEIIQKPYGTYYGAKYSTKIGTENVLFLWSRYWNTSNYRERAEIACQIRSNSNVGNIVKPISVLTPPLLDDSINKTDKYDFLSYPLSDNQGKVWFSYFHQQSGQPNQYFYMILDPAGNIWKGPVQTTGQRCFRFCDTDGKIWAEEAGQFFALNNDDTILVPPRTMAYIPNQKVGSLAASVAADGYRLYDRWSPQPVQIDVLSCANRNSMELFDLNLWNNALHPANLNLKKGDTSVWSQSGQFTGHTTVNMSGVLNEGQNLLMMTQNDFLGGQVLATFPYVLSIAGDVTGNGIVDFEDLAILADQWLQPPGNPSADIAPSPVDGIVNFLDFVVMAEHWLEGL